MRCAAVTIGFPVGWAAIAADWSGVRLVASASGLTDWSLDVICDQSRAMCAICLRLKIINIKQLRMRQALSRQAPGGFDSL